MIINVQNGELVIILTSTKSQNILGIKTVVKLCYEEEGLLISNTDILLNSARDIRLEVNTDKTK